MPLLLFLLLPLVSCSGNLLYNETTPHISIEVQKYIKDTSRSSSDTILTTDTVYFQAKINPATSSVRNFFWTINSKRTPYLQLWRIFDTAGVYNAGFYAVDFLGDTLSTNFTISVSNKPVCDNLYLKIFQGSPIFKWDCHDMDGDSLTYNFSLKVKNRADKTCRTFNTTLREDSLQLGCALPSDYWEVNITATNSYGFKAKLDSIWGTP